MSTDEEIRREEVVMPPEVVAASPSPTTEEIREVVMPPEVVSSPTPTEGYRNCLPEGKFLRAVEVGKTRAQVAFNRFWPWLAIGVVPFLNAGQSYINKKALANGMDYHVFTVYRNVIAFLVLLLPAYFERTAWQHVTVKKALCVAALAILEPVMNQSFTYTGLRRITASFSSSIGLLQPVIVFVLSCIFRLERVIFTARPSQLKVSGAIIAIVGAIIIAVSPSKVLIYLPWTNKHQSPPGGYLQENAVDGICFCLLAVFCGASYNLVLAKTLDDFQFPWTITTGTCLLGAIVNAVLAGVIHDSERTRWMISRDMSLVSYLYSGIMISAVVTFLVSIVTKKKGPVFVGAFSPLSMVLLTLAGTLFLHEQLYMIRLVASCILLIAMGLIIYGKSIEKEVEPPTTTPIVDEVHGDYSEDVDQKVERPAEKPVVEGAIEVIGA